MCMHLHFKEKRKSRGYECRKSVQRVCLKGTERNRFLLKALKS